MKRILVTGGAGFLGSHLIDRLLEQGHAIVCMDNLQTGAMVNISHVLDKIQFVQHDIIEPFPELGQFDEIYNLACPASPIHYQADPVHTFKTNVLGALNILELARKTGAKVFQASTSEVYGDPLVHPQPEHYCGNVNPIGIRSCYDEGKRGAETLFFDYARMYGIEIKVARIFNTYGPRMDTKDGRVVSNFIVQSLLKKPLTVYGDGKQTRSFCYVDDLIEGFLRLMATTKEVTGPVNLGNPNEFTMLELAEKVVKWTGNDTPLQFEKLPQDDPKQRRPVIAEAQRILDWEPKVMLDEGLQKTIAYFASKVQER
ncbi:UDP-glucuronic acid decarboxylase family protein [Lysinibacillus fusiformis]|uniref:UDP-glucuronic acid decarboxylase family protein n=1 Tax=Lysinibacillus fusiformis TaxID=28031 RepID=UPI00187FE036|nr:UDP-glucuronic acid decarboxylase family protein [Lysinibacillus fusiformis]MBD8519613.1 SDR family oxidoreductase [Lysinibacillus fusiformis]MCR8851195.1 SDR family oxidoreductase [Lysinibacillus fusiformis]